MSQLALIQAPNPIFRQKAAPVETVDDSIRALADGMLELMYAHRGIGVAANMVGVLKRVFVLDIQPDGKPDPLVCINPEILWRSDATSSCEEASLCFPGISADIVRPDAVRLGYLDLDGNRQEIDADGFLATVIQHELDYLDGKTYLDYLSKMKRDLLLKKMQKYVKQMQNHVHGPGCGHDHHEHGHSHDGHVHGPDCDHDH